MMRMQNTSSGNGDTYHVRRPAKLTSDKNTWGIGDTVGDNNLLDLVTAGILDSGAEVAESSSLSFTGSLLLIGLLELEAFL